MQKGEGGLTESLDSEGSPSGTECCVRTPLGPVGGRGDRIWIRSSSYLLERSTCGRRMAEVLVVRKDRVFLWLVYGGLYEDQAVFKLKMIYMTI